LDQERYEKVNYIFKDFLVKMVEGEALNVQVKRAKVVDTQRLLEVFEMEAGDIEACTKIGAIIGNGTIGEVETLSQYGRTLGTLFLLREDLMDALNFSVQLGNKLLRGSYPFPVLWAINNSKEFQGFLSILNKKKKVTPHEIKRCVQLLFESGAIDYTTKLMKELAGFAIRSLEKIKKSEAKKALELFAKLQPSMTFNVFFE
jgi:geranylgeranyl pyrophosphate synthase